MAKINQFGFSMILMLVLWTSIVGVLLYVLMAAAAPLAKNTVELVYKRKASSASASSLVDGKFEAEKFTVLTEGVRIAEESSASGKQVLVFEKNSTAIGIVSGKAKNLQIRANGNFCRGQPRLLLTVDGVKVFNNYIIPDFWGDYVVESNLDAGTHLFSLSFDNDYTDKGCDRDLKIDYILFTE